VTALFSLLGCDISKTGLQLPPVPWEGVAKSVLVVPNSVSRDGVQRVKDEGTGRGISQPVTGTLFFPENGWLDFLKDETVEWIRKENGSSGSGVGNPTPYILCFIRQVEIARIVSFDNDYSIDIAVFSYYARVTQD